MSKLRIYEYSWGIVRTAGDPLPPFFSRRQEVWDCNGARISIDIHEGFLLKRTRFPEKQSGWCPSPFAPSFGKPHRAPVRRLHVP